jgi:predicted nuclease of predicted toxin-antitoxin system
MRFLLDENVDLPLADFLEELAHDVTAIALDYTRSIRDQEVLRIALAETRILITNDKDFGELIYKQQLQHAGVIFFRLRDEDIPFKIARLEAVLAHHLEDLAAQAYIVVTDKRIRVRRR